MLMKKNDETDQALVIDALRLLVANQTLMFNAILCKEERVLNNTIKMLRQNISDYYERNYTCLGELPRYRAGLYIREDED